MFLTEREEGERRARGVRIEGASRGEERGVVVRREPHHGVPKETLSRFVFGLLSCMTPSEVVIV